MAAPVPTIRATFPVMEFMDVGDIAIALQNPEVETLVLQTAQRYHRIDVRSVMSDFKQVASLLAYAYQKSEGFNASAASARILSKYQTVIKDSLLTTTQFLDRCVTGLSYHRDAVEALDAGKDLDHVFRLFSRCVGLAQRMADQSAKLAEKAENLKDLAEEALGLAINDRNISEEQKRAIQLEMQQTKAEQNTLTAKMHELETSVREQQEAMNIALQQQKAAERRESALFWASIVAEPIAIVATKLVGGAGAICNFISEQLGSEVTNTAKVLEAAKAEVTSLKGALAAKEVTVRAKEEAEKNAQEQATKEKERTEKIALEQEIATLKVTIQAKEQTIQETEVKLAGLQERLRKSREDAVRRVDTIKEKTEQLKQRKDEANIDLIKAVNTLKTLSIKGNTLDTAIQSLRVCIKTLAKVKTVFDNARIFWKNVEYHATALTDVQRVQDHVEFAERDKIRKEIERSGMGWLALAKVNFDACNATDLVNQHVDEMFIHLGDPVIGNVADAIIREIEIEVKTERAIELKQTEEISNNNNEN